MFRFVNICKLRITLRNGLPFGIVLARCAILFNVGSLIPTSPFWAGEVGKYPIAKSAIRQQAVGIEKTVYRLSNY